MQSSQSTKKCNICPGVASEYTDPIVVCKASHIKENEMKQLSFRGDTKILLIKQNDQLYALGNKCTHYGAPLHTGILGEGRVRCPLHGACFNITNGDIEDYPGLDSLPCYKVEVTTDGEVKVSAKRSDLGKNRRLKDMVKPDPENKTTYVILGGGPAAGVCVETLRQQGFTGRIIMLCKENALPYDRIRVSKPMDISLEAIQFRNTDFYNKHSIEAILGVEADHVDTSKKCVHCNNGNVIQFDKLFIATGSRPFKPPIPGADLINVATVRNHADGVAILAAFKPGMNLVCMGSSFLALESIAYFAKKGAKSVTLIGRDDVPLKATFGPNIGERILRLYRENDIIMIMNSGITEIIGDSDGKVTELLLIDDTRIPCDLLIVAAGSRPNTEFLKNSGIQMHDNGAVITDDYLVTNIPNIYAGGDIAFAPVFSLGYQKAKVEGIQMAQYHGHIAAINMAADSSNFKQLHTVPFFFTLLFGKGFGYAGYGSFTDTYIEGDVDNLSFVQYYLNEKDTVVAVAACGRDPIVSQFAELQWQGKSLQRSDIIEHDDPTAWTRKLLEKK